MGVSPYNETTLEGTWTHFQRGCGQKGHLRAVQVKVLSLADVPQEGLLAEATAFRDANIVDVASYDELRSAIEEGKWARGPWAGDDDNAMHCLTSCMPGRLPGRYLSLSRLAFLAARCACCLGSLDSSAAVSAAHVPAGTPCQAEACSGRCFLQLHDRARCTPTCPAGHSRLEADIHVIMCAGSDEDEKRVKEETTATLRCIPFDQPTSVGPCCLTGAPAEEVAIFAKAY